MNNHGSEIGFNYKVDNYLELPVDVNDSTDIRDLVLLHNNTIEIFGLITGMRNRQQGGSEFAGESGRHADIKRQESETTLFPVLDDMNDTQTLFAMALKERAVRLIKPNKLYKLIDDKGNVEKEIRYSYEQIERMREAVKDDGCNIRINDTYLTTYKQQQYDLYLMIFDMVAKYYGAEVQMPGELFRRSELDGANEMADEIDAIWIEKYQFQLESGDGDGGGNENQNQKINNG